MSGYINLVLKSKKTKVLFISQVFVFIAMAVTAANYMHWLGAYPISHYNDANYEKPSWAKSYAYDHGVPIFYKDSPKEEKGKYYLIILILFLLWLFLIMTMVAVYRVNGESFPWFKIKLYEKEKP